MGSGSIGARFVSRGSFVDGNLPGSRWGLDPGRELPWVVGWGGAVIAIPAERLTIMGPIVNRIDNGGFGEYNGNGNQY